MNHISAVTYKVKEVFDDTGTETIEEKFYRFYGLLVKLLKRKEKTVAISVQCMIGLN